jgi:hypothetical protein
VLCLAHFVSLGPGQGEAIIFIDAHSIGTLFEQDQSGHWKRTAQLQGDFTCSDIRQAIETGAIGMQPHAWPDLVIGTDRVEVYSFLRMCGSP